MPTPELQISIDTRRLEGRRSRRRGRERELDLRDLLKRLGWACERVDGAGDLIAGLAGYTFYIEVKSTVKPFETFGPTKRRALLEECRTAEWTPMLVHWPKGLGIDKARWIPATDWPPS